MLSILLPTDFSENSMNSIKYALEFFKYQKTEFYFMHAYQNEFYDHEELVSREVFDDVLNNVRKQSQQNLDQLLKKYRLLKKRVFDIVEIILEKRSQKKISDLK